MALYCSKDKAKILKIFYKVATQALPSPLFLPHTPYVKLHIWISCSSSNICILQPAHILCPSDRSIPPTTSSLTHVSFPAYSQHVYWIKQIQFTTSLYNLQVNNVLIFLSFIFISFLSFSFILFFKIIFWHISSMGSKLWPELNPYPLHWKCGLNTSSENSQECF